MDKFLHVSPPIGLIKVLQEEAGHKGSPNIYMKQQNAIDPIIYCFALVQRRIYNRGYSKSESTLHRFLHPGGIEGGSCRVSFAAGRSCLVGFPWLRLGGGESTPHGASTKRC